LILPLVLCTTLISACDAWLPRAHRPDYIIGNAVKPEHLAQLKVGMTRQRVVELIGNPSLLDPFHSERWDYLYRYTPGRGVVEQSRLTLYFNADSLQRIDSSAYTLPVDRDESGAIIDTPTSDAPPSNID
jgi:outer membrane protein assembly factor BamE